MPFTPLMLSEVSPCRAFSCMSCMGSRPPYISPNFSGVTWMSSLVVCSSTVTLSLTSCRESLSPVRIYTISPPCPKAERVPKMSSASNPSHSRTEMPMARSMSLIKGICAARSSGIPWRFALYSADFLWRKVGAFRSNATAAWSAPISPCTRR